jgi:CDP-glucose 4,6-dehydratase
VIIVVTTDKCYENRNTDEAYREDDRLGGHDPYSASKACAEIVVASYRQSFFADCGQVKLASARAGNVIGGGDWSEDRLIPDLARAQEKGEELPVRSPNSTRPWQHVLEPLAGYLQLGQHLYEGKKEFEGAWNFGPDDTGALSVSGLLDRLKKNWAGIGWHVGANPDLHETAMLRLDSSKARKKLNWKPVLAMDDQLKLTAEWYQAYQERGTIISRAQLEFYQHAAKAGKAVWA